MISFLVKFYAVGDANEARIGSYPPLDNSHTLQWQFQENRKRLHIEIGQTKQFKADNKHSRYGEKNWNQVDRHTSLRYLRTHGLHLTSMNSKAH